MAGLFKPAKCCRKLLISVIEELKETHSPISMENKMGLGHFDIVHINFFLAFNDTIKFTQILLSVDATNWALALRSASIPNSLVWEYCGCDVLGCSPKVSLHPQQFSLGVQICGCDILAVDLRSAVIPHSLV
jgi:hypothetical protein